MLHSKQIGGGKRYFLLVLLAISVVLIIPTANAGLIDWWLVRF